MTTWMAAKNFTEYYEVENYYTNRLIGIVENHGAKVIMWQDPIDLGVVVCGALLSQLHAIILFCIMADPGRTY